MALVSSAPKRLSPVIPLCLLAASGCLPGSCSLGIDPLLSQPAPWAWQMEHFSVDPHRGKRWELDPDWVMPMASVPAPVMLPDRRYGLFYSHMTLMGNRPLLVSDDGLSWAEEPLSRWPVEVFPQYCGNRLEDVAPWVQTPDAYRLVFMGHYDPLYGWGEAPPDGDHATRLCHLSSADLVNYQASDSYLWRGTHEGEDNSVFSVLSTAAGKGLFFYNGDVGISSRVTTGIRALTVDAETLEVDSIIAKPLDLDTVVDPHAVFLEGGGVRLYATNLADHPSGVKPGVVFLDLDSKLRPTGPLQQAIVSPGHCNIGEDWSCGCILDPAYVRLADGTMVMYVGFLEEDDQEICSLNLRRFLAVD